MFDIPEAIFKIEPMFLIKRIVTIISATLGASLGLLVAAFANWALNLHATFSHVFLYGTFLGAIGGVGAAYMLTIYLMKKAKKFVKAKVEQYSQRFTLRSI